MLSLIRLLLVAHRLSPMAAVQLWPGISAADTDLWPGHQTPPWNWKWLHDQAAARRAAKWQFRMLNAKNIKADCERLSHWLEAVPCDANDTKPILALPCMANLQSWDDAHRLPAARAVRLEEYVEEFNKTIQKLYNDATTLEKLHCFIMMLMPKLKRKAASRKRKAAWDSHSDSHTSDSDRDSDSDSD